MRRSANLCYRASRFNNRTKPEGWLAPSLQHRVDTTRVGRSPATPGADHVSCPRTCVL